MLSGMRSCECDFVLSLFLLLSLVVWKDFVLYTFVMVCCMGGVRMIGFGFEFSHALRRCVEWRSCGQLECYVFGACS